MPARQRLPDDGLLSLISAADQLRELYPVTAKLLYDLTLDVDRKG
jgi:hypothetical protein